MYANHFLQSVITKYNEILYAFKEIKHVHKKGQVKDWTMEMIHAKVTFQHCLKVHNFNYVEKFMYIFMLTVLT